MAGNSVAQRLWDAGVLHGSVSGDTIWFTDNTDDADIKLSGFDESQLCQSGHLLVRTTNQVQYRAPEMFKRQYSFHADAWALGAVLYEALTGRAAFCGTGKSGIVFGLLQWHSTRSLCVQYR